MCSNVHMIMYSCLYVCLFVCFFVCLYMYAYVYIYVLIAPELLETRVREFDKAEIAK